MPLLVAFHVITGPLGIVAGFGVVVAIAAGRTFRVVEAIFFISTLAACVSGMVYLPKVGLTSAQLVGFFITLLLAIAAVARFVGKLRGAWRSIFALTVVGSLFLNVLITITQSFQRVPVLVRLAPDEHSPIYIATKLIVLGLFVLLALATARIASRASNAED